MVNTNYHTKSAQALYDNINRKINLLDGKSGVTTRADGVVSHLDIKLYYDNELVGKTTASSSYLKTVKALISEIKSTDNVKKNISSQIKGIPDLHTKIAKANEIVDSIGSLQFVKNLSLEQYVDLASIMDIKSSGEICAFINSSLSKKFIESEPNDKKKIEREISLYVRLIKAANLGVTDLVEIVKNLVSGSNTSTKFGLLANSYKENLHDVFQFLKIVESKIDSSDINTMDFIGAIDLKINKENLPKIISEQSLQHILKTDSSKTTSSFTAKLLVSKLSEQDFLDFSVEENLKSVEQILTFVHSPFANEFCKNGSFPKERKMSICGSLAKDANLDINDLKDIVNKVYNSFKVSELGALARAYCHGNINDLMEFVKVYKDVITQSTDSIANFIREIDTNIDRYDFINKLSILTNTSINIKEPYAL